MLDIIIIIIIILFTDLLLPQRLLSPLLRATARAAISPYTPAGSNVTSQCIKWPEYPRTLLQNTILIYSFFPSLSYSTAPSKQHTVSSTLRLKLNVEDRKTLFPLSWIAANFLLTPFLVCSFTYQRLFCFRMVTLSKWVFRVLWPLNQL